MRASSAPTTQPHRRWRGWADPSDCDEPLGQPARPVPAGPRLSGQRERTNYAPRWKERCALTRAERHEAGDSRPSTAHEVLVDIGISDHERGQWIGHRSPRSIIGGAGATHFLATLHFRAECRTGRHQAARPMAARLRVQKRIVGSSHNVSSSIPRRITRAISGTLCALNWQSANPNAAGMTDQAMLDASAICYALRCSCLARQPDRINRYHHPDRERRCW
jgi:hypothetical protein